MSSYSYPLRRWFTKTRCNLEQIAIAPLSEKEEKAFSHFDIVTSPGRKKGRPLLKVWLPHPPYNLRNIPFSAVGMC